MKLYHLLKKDFKLFVRDKKTVALIILTPIIIMSILTVMFGQTGAGESITGISLGVCNLDQQQHREIYDLPMFTTTTIRGKNCENKAQELVQDGELRGAIVIPQGFASDIEQGTGAELRLYVDGAKSQTAIVTTDSFKALTHDINQEIGTAFIEQAWIQLSELNTNLKQVVTQLLTAQQTADELEETLNNYTSQLNTINFKDIKDDLNEINTVSTNTTTELIDELLINAMGAHALLCTTPEPGCAQLQNIITDLQTLQNIIATQEATTESLQAVLDEINEVEEFQDNTLKELNKLQRQVQDYKNQTDTTVIELEQTTQTLDEYTARDPATIINPVTLLTEKFYSEKRYVENLSPGLIAILLLFITLLISSADLIIEKKTGTLTRNLLSPTTLTTILTQKMIYLTTLGIIQFMLMLMILAFFSITIPLTIPLAIVAILTIIMFTSLGLFIGSLASSENTALLTCLVASIPMMFLCGVFFPFEVMPPLIQTIAQHLPLTLSVANLEKIIIYHTAIDSTKLFEAILISAALLYLTHRQVKKKIKN